MADIRYLGIAFLVILFFVFYAWQNIEVMKLKIEYVKKVKLEKIIIKDNDKLRYKIERFKRVEIVEKYSRDNDLKRMGPEDFTLIKIKDKPGKNK